MLLQTVLLHLDFLQRVARGIVSQSQHPNSMARDAIVSSARLLSNGFKTMQRRHCATLLSYTVH